MYIFHLLQIYSIPLIFNSVVGLTLSKCAMHDIKGFLTEREVCIVKYQTEVF